MGHTHTWRWCLIIPKRKNIVTVILIKMSNLIFNNEDFKFFKKEQSIMFPQTAWWYIAMFILITSLEFNIEAKSTFPIIGKYLQLILNSEMGNWHTPCLPVIVGKHLNHCSFSTRLSAQPFSITKILHKFFIPSEINLSKFTESLSFLIFSKSRNTHRHKHTHIHMSVIPGHMYLGFSSSIKRLNAQNIKYL